MNFPFTLVLLCLMCGFMSSHSIGMALLIFPFHLVILWIGGWFVPPLSLETMILVGALLLSAIAGCWAGELFRRRSATNAVEDFVPPPPPPDWLEKRRMRLQGASTTKSDSDPTRPE